MVSFKWGHLLLLFDQSIDCLFVQYWYSCFAPCIRKFGRISWLAFFLHGTKQNVRSQFCPFTGWLSKVYEMIHSVKDISTAAVVTAVTLSMATMYIIFGSKILPKSSKRKLRGPRGLVNPQRSCYMNAVWVWLQKQLLQWKGVVLDLIFVHVAGCKPLHLLKQFKIGSEIVDQVHWSKVC